MWLTSQISMVTAADILGLNDNGSLNVWAMNGTSLVGGGPVVAPPQGWHMVAYHYDLV